MRNAAGELTDGFVGTIELGLRYLVSLRGVADGNIVGRLFTCDLELQLGSLLRQTRHALEVRVLVAGAEKAATLEAVLRGTRDPDRLPAQRLNDACGRVVWMVDAAAAGRL